MVNQDEYVKLCTLPRGPCIKNPVAQGYWGVCHRKQLKNNYNNLSDVDKKKDETAEEKLVQFTSAKIIISNSSFISMQNKQTFKLKLETHLPAEQINYKVRKNGWLKYEKC